MQPWFESGRQICADSFIASVKMANALLEKRFRFTRVIENAIRGFSMKHWSETTLSDRGDYRYVISKRNSFSNALMAIVWMDREMTYLMSTIEIFNPGIPISPSNGEDRALFPKWLSSKSPLERFGKIITKHFQ